MPLLRICLCLLVFSVFLLTSCTLPEKEERIESPDFFRHVNPAEAMENIAEAIRSGKVFIQDEKGYDEVFGFDSFRFNDKNIRLMNLSFLPGTNGFRCLALVLDSRTEDNRYCVLFFTGGTDRNSTLSLIGVGETAGEKDAPPPVLPEPSAVAVLCEAMQRRIQAGDVSWDQNIPGGTASELPGNTSEKKEKKEQSQPLSYLPEREWWKDRLTAQKGNLRLAENDLSLCGVSVSPENEIVLSYSVRPLTVRATSRIVAYAVLNAVLSRDGTLLRTYEGREKAFEDTLSVILYPFTQQDNDEIYKAVFDYLFEQSSSKVGNAVPAERVRFLLVPETASPDFMTKYSWRGGIPVRNPFMRDWELPVPFNENAGRYTEFGNGEFYYFAGAIRPVDDSTAYVMANIACMPPFTLSRFPPEAEKAEKTPHTDDIPTRFNGPTGYLKLKKGFFGWYVDQDHIFSLSRQTGTNQGKP